MWSWKTKSVIQQFLQCDFPKVGVCTVVLLFDAVIEIAETPALTVENRQKYFIK